MSESGTPEAILSADEFARQLFLYGNQMCLGDAAGTTAACDALTQHDAAQRKALEYETLSATHHMNRAGFDADEIEALRAEVERLQRVPQRLRAEALAAEVERLTAERDAYMTVCAQHEAIEIALNARVAELTEALAKYGQHAYDCRTQDGMRGAPTCTCGLDALAGVDHGE